MTRLQRRSRCRCARFGFTYIELLVIIAIIVLAIAFLIPVRTRDGGCSNRVKCASNLRQIGQAILLYSNDNHGAYPRTTYLPDAMPVYGTGVSAGNPFMEGGPQPNDVTAALFMLLRTQDITSEVFTCPSSNAEKDVFGGGTNGPINRSNFTSVKLNLSYSIHNPYPRAKVSADDPRLTSRMTSEFAVAADLNPGTGNGDNVLLPSMTSSAIDMRRANSHNHDRDGQNILYGDGHVAWESNPFVGVNRDNIYTTADGKVLAPSVDANDSILLPTDD